MKISSLSLLTLTALTLFAGCQNATTPDAPKTYQPTNAEVTAALKAIQQDALSDFGTAMGALMTSVGNELTTKMQAGGALTASGTITTTKYNADYTAVTTAVATDVAMTVNFTLNADAVSASSGYTVKKGVFLATKFSALKGSSPTVIPGTFTAALSGGKVTSLSLAYSDYKTQAVTGAVTANGFSYAWADVNPATH